MAARRKGSLTYQLRRLLSEEVGIDEDEMRKAKEVMQNVTQKILDGLKEDEHRLIKKFEYTGSAYEGSKIMSADEFDVMIIFDGSLDGGLVRNKLTPGYVSLRPRDKSAESTYGRFLQTDRSADGKRYLDPELTRRAFKGLVQKQINRLEISNATLSLRDHGPAVMLRINDEIDVDLVLAFSVDKALDRFKEDSDRFIAKAFKDNADYKEPRFNTVSADLLWRRSFSKREKNKLDCIDRGNECRRQCLKILKWIREQDTSLQKLTSYHFKTLLFHECEGRVHWTNDNLAECFLRLLRRLRDCLKEKKLQHYFVPKLNLLDGIREITIKNMEERVKTLIDSKQERTKLLSGR